MTEMLNPKRHHEFTELLRENYGRVYGYILSLVHRPEDAYDVFQEASVTLWEKYDQYDSHRDFGAWACGVARLKVLEHLKKTKRQRQNTIFSESLIDSLTDIQDSQSDLFSERKDALAHCMGKLSADQRTLLLRCYDGKHSVKHVAIELDRSTHSIYSSLRHLRTRLLMCIDQQLDMEGSS